MAVLTRAALGMAAAALATGCDPEIVDGAYLCGPQMTCQDGMVCNAADATCVRPEVARPFACPTGTTDAEPNDTAAAATELAIAACPVSSAELVGCTTDPTDQDWVAVTAPASCAGRPLTIQVRYAAAFAPALVDRMNADGTVAESAAICDITGGLGANDAVCLTTLVPAGGTAVLRVTIDAELDCSGACDFNHYSLAVGVAP